MKLSKKHSALFQIIAGTIILMILQFQPTFFSITTDSPQHFNKKLNEKELETRRLLTALKTQKKYTSFEFLSEQELNSLYEHQGIALFVLKNNRPVFWSNRNIVLPNNLSVFNSEAGAIQLTNGWFQYIIEEKNDLQYLALILIKKQFKIENKFLKNEFHSSYRFQNNFDVSIKTGKYPIKSVDDSTLFYLTEKPFPSNTYKKTNWIILLLFFIGIVLITSGINILIIRHHQLKALNLFAVFIFLALIRVFTAIYTLPESVFNQEIFSPIVYAHSSFFPSLGDFLIHIIFFFILIY